MRHKLIAVIVSLLIVTGVHAGNRPPSNIKFIIGIGQSNDDGRGLLSEWPASRPLNPSKIWTYRFDGTWKNPAVEPIADSTNSVYPIFNLGGNINNGVGHSLMLADLLQRSHDWIIGIIPCARGGAGYSKWLPSNDTATLYGACRARWQAAVAQTGGTILAVEMYGGESDAMLLTDANMVAARSSKIITQLRKDIHGVAIIYNQIGPRVGATAMAKFPYWHLVKTKQAGIKMPNTVIVMNGDSLSTLADGVHLDTRSQMDVGARNFNALAKLKGWITQRSN